MRLLPVLALLVACAHTPPPQQAADGPSPLLPLKTDDVTAGTLPNGFRYIIESNAKPEDRVVFRLAIDAGSILEEDRQQGLAHFLEHMAFNGTENFPGNTLIQKLESEGVSFGAHLNAHTSFDETVYKLKLPDDPEMLDLGLRIFRDWAGGIVLDPEEVDKERGVVLGEWRTRQATPDGRVQQELWDHDYDHSRYGVRLPIGDPEVLESFTVQDLQDFLDDWYRPDLMTLVVVGQVDHAAVQARITELFGDLQTPEAAPERARYELGPYPDEPPFVVADPELRSTYAYVSRILPEQPQRTEADYVDDAMRGLARSVVNARLAEVARDPEAPFRSAGIVERDGMGGSRTQSVWVTWYDGREAEAMERVAAELARVWEHGVEQVEVDAVLSQDRESNERWKEEWAFRKSTSVANEWVRHVMTGESVPGEEVEYRLKTEAQDALTVAWVQDHLSGWTWVREGHLTGRVKGPEDQTAVTGDTLQSAWSKGLATDLGPWETTTVDGDPWGQWPAHGAVTASRHYDDLDATLYELSNGMKVVVKPTDLAEAEVQVRGYRPSEASFEDLMAWGHLWAATGVVDRSGMGTMDVEQLRLWKAGRRLGGAIRPGTTAHGFYMTTRTDDLEDSLRTLITQAQQPRFTGDAVSKTKAEYKQNLSNTMDSPSGRFQRALQAKMWSGTAWEPWEPEHVDALELDEMEQAWQTHLKTMDGTTWVIVGSVDMDAMPELLASTLATIPTAGPDAPPLRVGPMPHLSDDPVVVHGSDDDQATYQGSWYHTTARDWASRSVPAELLSSIASRHLRERLREDMGGTYGVRFWVSAGSRHTDRMSLSMSFVCKPDELQDLREAGKQVLADLAAGHITQADLDIAKEQATVARKESMKSNGYWMSTLAGELNHTGSLDGWVDPQVRQDVVTLEQVKSLAAEVLTREHGQEGWLVP